MQEENVATMFCLQLQTLFRSKLSFFTKIFVFLVNIWNEEKHFKFPESWLLQFSERFWKWSYGDYLNITFKIACKFMFLLETKKMKFDFNFHEVPIARLEGFRTLKFSKMESFKALKLSRFVSLRVLNCHDQIWEFDGPKILHFGEL